MREREETKLLGTFFTALLIGVGLAALFTPQSGRRTRKDLERLGRRTKDLVWDFQESIKESLDDLIEEVAEVTRESLEKGNFYSTQGPIINSVKAAGNTISIHLIQQIDKRRNLFLNLVFSTKNMGIILGEISQPHQAVQSTRRFIAMAGAKLRHT